ncbi:OmpW family protein, partial [Burkholderia cenocepacia]|nr:OmpW family protein [Burkholderia cenocepacia]
MKKTLLCAAAGAAAVAPLAAPAQSAGSNVVTLGWFHIMPQQSSTPMTTNVAPTPINPPLRLPPSFTSAGTGLHTSGADTV